MLNDIYKEVRRVVITGSRIVRDDYRLKNIIPAAEKLAESSPVFKRLSGLLGEVFQSRDPDTPLFDLSVLVHAMLYTQGETNVNGEKYELKAWGLNYPTATPYRVLKAVTSALTRTGSGRMKVLREHTDIGPDLRLIRPLISALDGYNEIADFAFVSLLKYKDDILFLLQQGYSPKGGKGHARRLALIYLLSGDRGNKENEDNVLFTGALEKGSVEVKVKALHILADFKKHRNLVKEYKSHKNIDLQEAAHAALRSKNARKFFLKELEYEKYPS